MSDLPTVLITAARPAVAAEGGTLDLLVRIQAPAAPPAGVVARTPLRLALVIDRSGSMNGQPLNEALACARHVAACLTPADQVGIVLYDDTVQVAVPLQAGGDSRAVAAALDGVASGGSTDLFAGWQAGAALLGQAPAGALSRVLLLSDGQANRGLVDPAAIALHCRDAHEHGIDTTTVGLGPAFNEDLMVGMARAGGGRQYYGQTVADLADGFDEELALLQALHLRNLAVRLLPAPGVIVESLSVQPAGAELAFRLGDVAYGGEAWMLVRLHVGPSADARRPLLAALVRGQRLDGSALETAAPLLELPVLPLAQVAALPEDGTLDRRRAEVQFALMADDVRAALGRRDRVLARRLLADAAGLATRHEWLRERLAALQALLERDEAMAAKELLYTARKMRDRLVARDEAGFSGDETAGAVPAFLRRKSEEGKGRPRGG